MKRFFTLTALLFLMLLPSQAQQEVGSLLGYTNVNVQVKAATAGSGKVAVTPPDGGIEAFMEVFPFKHTLPVSTGEMVYFKVNGQPANGYFFGGWYLDDGDGKFDIAKDYTISQDLSSFVFLPVTYLKGYVEETSLFETEAEAKAATKPADAQAIIYAYFFNGATVAVDHYMDNCGTVEISKPVNTVGDEVTIKAIPAEGYQFEYWKTGYGSQWPTDQPNTSVSTEAEWTFTVKGGERYFAYFSAVDAPVLQFPEEGGWIATVFDKEWILHEQADATVYNFVLGDIVTNDQQQSYFNLDDEDAQYDVARLYSDARRGFGNKATLMYGKGKVRFTHYIPGLGFDRAFNILEWSGPKGITITDKDNAMGYHVYGFDATKKAFVKIGTTDLYSDDNAPQSIAVPANMCYICLEGMQIADPETDYIPTVIGMTAADYDHAIAGIEEIGSVQSATSDACYDLLGRRLQSQPVRGLYIRGGKKYVVK